MIMRLNYLVLLLLCTILPWNIVLAQFVPTECDWENYAPYMYIDGQDLISSYTYNYTPDGKYYIYGEVNGNLSIYYNFMGAPLEPEVVTDYLMEGNMTFWGTPSNLQATAHTSLNISNGSDFDWTIIS